MPYYHNDDIINPNGIDFVEVDKLVNPPNASNAGKVVGIGEDGKAALIEGGGGLPEVTSEDNGDVLTVVNGEWAKAKPGGLITGTLYAVDAATTDPDLTEDFTDPKNNVNSGLSQTEGGTPLTYAEIVEFMDTHDAVDLVIDGSTEHIAAWKKTDGVLIDDASKPHLTAAYVSPDGLFGCDFTNGGTD